MTCFRRAATDGRVGIAGALPVGGFGAEKVGGLGAEGTVSESERNEALESAKVHAINIKTPS